MGRAQRTHRLREMGGFASLSPPYASLLPHRLLQPRHCDAVARQLIGTLVLDVAVVAPDPVPAHLVRFQSRVQPLPRFDFFPRFLVGGAPAVLLPAVDPAGDTLAD